MTDRREMEGINEIREGVQVGHHTQPHEHAFRHGHRAGTFSVSDRSRICGIAFWRKSGNTHTAKAERFPF